MCIKKTGNYETEEELIESINKLTASGNTKVDISKVVGVSTTTIGRIILKQKKKPSKVYNRAEMSTRNVKLVRELNKLWIPTEVPNFDEELGEYVYE